MTPTFAVRYSDGAREDLFRLFEFLLERAQTAEDFNAAQRALAAVQEAVERQLSRSPFAYRKVGSSPFLRELLIAWGAGGYVALYEIDDAAHVTVLALRHQREDDYH